MPMYDFRCAACSCEFEEMASGNECPQCPSCGSADTERLLAAPSLKTNPMPFKVGPVRPMPPRPVRSGGPCGGGGCSGGCGGL